MAPGGSLAIQLVPRFRFSEIPYLTKQDGGRWEERDVDPQPSHIRKHTHTHTCTHMYTVYIQT